MVAGVDAMGLGAGRSMFWYSLYIGSMDSVAAVRDINILNSFVALTIAVIEYVFVLPTRGWRAVGDVTLY